MHVSTLEQIIKQYINLPSQPSGTGWYPILCKVCNDSGKKGPRAGFKFDNGKVAYHCFNCSHTTVYDPDTHVNMPQKMVQVLNDFSVPEDEWRQVLITGLANHDNSVKLASQKTNQSTQSIEPMPISLPSHFYPLASASPNDVWAEIARDYLEHIRKVDPNSYPFYLAHKINEPKLNHWFGRVIIPIYKNGSPIFYIGRDLTGKKQKKYLNPSISREKIIYGFDELFRQTDEPLYIVEGWFDAHVINGVAILGNEISNTQAMWINKSPRKKVYIPDRSGNGKQTALQALSLGWSVATPGKDTWSDDIKDMNDAVKKYGKIFVLKSIVETIATGFNAEVNVGMYCSHEKINKNCSKKKNHSTPPQKRTYR